MQVITPITLDLTRPGFPPSVDAKQGDSTRYILASITDNGVPWQIPDNAIGIVGVQKPDGKECWYEYLPDGSPAVTFAGSAATFALAPAALEAAGDGFADVSLYNADKQKLTTFGFHLRIERAAATEGEITSSDYYNILTEEIAAALRAAESAVNMTIESTVLPPDSTPTLDVEWEGTDLKLTFGLSPGVRGEQGVQGIQGEKGDKGDQGDKGDKGDKGDQGDKGDTGAAAGFAAPTIEITTLNPGQSATAEVTATGPDTAKAFAFSLGVPKGDKGEKGDPGVITELTGGMFAMYVDLAGDLILTVADDAEIPPLSINADGDLIYTIS